MFSLCALLESGVEKVDILTCWRITAHSCDYWSSLGSQTEFQPQHGGEVEDEDDREEIFTFGWSD